MFVKLFSEYIQNCIEALETSDIHSIKEDMKSIKATLGDAYEYELSRFIHAFTISGFGGVSNEEEEREHMAEVIHHLARQYKQMCKIYTFHVSVIGNENHVWRTIQLPAQVSLETLGYAVMASMNCDGSHLFNITYKKRAYECSAGDIDFEAPPASEVMLGELNLNKKSRLVMEYDYGESYQFDIRVTQIQTTKTMPYDEAIQIVDGHGFGILEDAHYVFDAYFSGDEDTVLEYLDAYGEEMEDFELAQPFDLEECKEMFISKMDTFKMYYQMGEGDFDYDEDEDEESDDDWFHFA